MKKLRNTFGARIALFALLCIGTFQAIGQNFELGLRFMPTFNSFEITTPGEGRLKTDLSAGFGIGGILGVNVWDHVGIQGEVIYSSISQKYKEFDNERKINLKYLNIPILLSLNTGKTKAVNLNLVAGPQIGISVGSSLSGTGSDSTRAVLSVKKGDLGFAYGAGVDFGINRLRRVRFSLGFRGVFGLFDISDNSRNITTDSYYLLDRTHIQSYAGYAGLSFLF